MLFSLKFQRNNQQNALVMDSVKGKPDKKAVFSVCCGDKTIICPDRGLAFTGAYPQENGFASGTFDAKPFFAGNTFSCETPYQRRNLRGSGGNAREPQPWRSIFSAMAGALRTGPLSNP